MAEQTNEQVDSGQPWRRSTRIWVTIAGVLGAAVMIVLAVWLWATLAGMQEELDALDERVADLETASDSSNTTRDDEEDKGDDDEDEDNGDDRDDNDEDDTSDVLSDEVEMDTGRKLVVIEEADWLEDPVLAVDYLGFLTGQAAIDAAEARGDESPPPNDYYIFNDEEQAIPLGVDRSINVTLTTNSDGTVDPDGYTVPFGLFFDGLVGMSGQVPGMWEANYWVTIENGTITAIEQQYLP
jgi:hypothetical protein